MSDISCPVCGKSNPSDLEFCQNCQARLDVVVDPLLHESEKEELPDSLLPGEASEPEKPPQEEVDDADWFSDLRQRGDIGEQPSSEDATGPDWLSSGESEDEEIPEWLSSLGSETVAEPDFTQPEEPAVISPEDDEEPEWLHRVRARKHAEEGEQTQPTGVDEISDSFVEDDQIKGDDETAPPEISKEVRPLEVDEDELPDWLSSFDDTGEEPQVEERKVFAEDVVETPLEDILASDPEIPAWISELSDAEIQPDLDIDEDQAEVDLPEWLAEEEEADEAFASPDAEDAIPKWIAGVVGAEMVGEIVAESEPEAEDVSEWQAWLTEAATEDEEVVPPTTEEAPEVDLELSEELAAIEKPLDEEDVSLEPDGEVSIPFTFDEEGEDLFDVEVAEWLSEIPPQDVLEEESALEQDGGLETAELPIWLAAMRPVEAAAHEALLPDKEEHQVERSGPLAGLSGILPAGPEIARVKKTSAYAIKLQVSDSQQAHVGMLEDLVKTEGAVKPIPERAGISSQHALRLVIFFVLLLAVLLPIISGSQVAPLPALAAETIDTRNAINALPNAAPVLLAVEYEPGLSGEMDAASASVVDHLMIKGAYLTFVSSSTMGPAQAERLVSVVNNSVGHEYQAASQYVNLGYISGGPTGLLGFARSPRQTIPFALDNSPIWESGPLSDVQKLADFALVLVLTENPDTARAWIEQVQPTLEDTPMLMVISAQAEPLVRPYYEGSPQQVQGMVTGLAGGASYENSMPRTSLAREYWDSFSIGMLVAAVLIALGGVVNAAYSLLTRRKQTGGDI